MPPSRMRDVLGQDLRPDDQVAYIIPSYKSLVIGRVRLMHMDSVMVERLQPPPANDYEHDELRDKNKVVRVHRPI